MKILPRKLKNFLKLLILRIVVAYENKFLSVIFTFLYVTSLNLFAKSRLQTENERLNNDMSETKYIVKDIEERNNEFE